MNNIYIGQNIKKLRAKSNTTQEKLAEYLSVSYQAVSKWERNEAYPDITLIPLIARFFNTTTDELLGVDNDKYEAEIKSFLAESHSLKNQGEVTKSRELSFDMYQKYPNDFRVTERYMWDVFYDPDYDYDNHQNLPDWRTIHSDELIPISEKILSDCTDDRIRFSAIELLIMIYTGLKEYDTALEYSKRLQNPDSKLGYILGEKDPKLSRYYQQLDFVNAVTNMFPMFLFARYMLNNPKESIELYKSAINLYLTIFKEDNLGGYSWYVARFYDFISEQHLILGEYDEAMTNIEIAADYYIKADNVPNGYKYTSPMTDSLVNDTESGWKTYKGRISDWQISQYTEEKMFDPLRNSKRFEAVLQKLKG